MTNSGLVLGAVGAFSGASCGPLVTTWAARRAQAQPVSVDVEAEEGLVARYEALAELVASGRATGTDRSARPGEGEDHAQSEVGRADATLGDLRLGALDAATRRGLIALAGELEAEDFAHEPRGERWAGACARLGVGAANGTQDIHGGDEREDDYEDEHDGLNLDPVEIYAAELAAHTGVLVARGESKRAKSQGQGAEASVLDEAMDWIERVAACAADRNLDGARGLEATGDPEAPLARRAVPTSPLRWRVVSVVLGAVGALIGLLSAATSATMPEATLQGGALLLLAVGLTVLSLVDIDTLYVDNLTYWLTTAVVWPLVALQALVAGQGGRLVAGLGITVALIAAIEAVAFVYRRVRKRGGLGGGDVLLLVLVAGVPGSAVGDWRVAVWGVLMAMGATIAVRVSLIVAGRTTSREPFAFGPYLAGGWLAAWAVLVVSGALGGN